MVSVYQIAFDFIERYYKVEPEGRVKAEIIRQFKIALDMGWSSEAIMDKINKFHPANGVPLLDKMFPGLYGGDDKNLLQSSEFYYHNLLRVCPPPPTQAWDINTGEIKTITEDFFLEMRASISAQQITQYYIEQMRLDPKQITNMNRYVGSINYLIEKNGVDLVLFMIDVTANHIFSEDLQKPTTPVSIMEHIEDASGVLNQKLSETKAAGDDKIVYRKRVLSFGSRSQEERPVEGLLHQEYSNYA